MRDPDALIARAGIRPDTDRDQHFLVDDRILDRLPRYLDDVELAPIDPDATPTTDPEVTPPSRSDDSENVIQFLEVGAGTGGLTDRLLQAGDRVVAVERDPQLVSFLEREFAEAIEDDRLEVVAGDALEVELPEYSAAVSNLPYGVASEILFRLLARRRPTVSTVQREFAERMVASPGTAEYGRLSVSAQHFASVEVVEVVPREAFRPPPAVESAIVRTVPRSPGYEVGDEAFFLRFVKALFTQRRKTLRNAIRNSAHVSGIDDPEAVVEAADESLLGKRPDAVAPDEFASLATLATDVGLDADRS